MEQQLETIVFGGGCFWCTEAVFKMMKGVENVTSGYAGGHVPNPTYRQVSTGSTGHAEVAKVDYDPSATNFRNLLTIFFASHDATQLNRQGADIGTQYRSVVFYTTDEQKSETEAFIKELNESSSDGDPIVTQIEPLTTFYPAEDYHQNYYDNNRSQGYCQIVIAPKLQKVQEHYATLLKSQS